MKAVLSVVGLLFAVFVALSIITGTSLVGEVVTLHTRGADGEWETTPLWVVDLGKASYLRAGNPASGWVIRGRANPEIRLERSGDVADIKLVEEPTELANVHAQMAEKYGWANDFVGLLAPDRSLALSLRIEPL